MITQQLTPHDLRAAVAWGFAHGLVSLRTDVPPPRNEWYYAHRKPYDQKRLALKQRRLEWLAQNPGCTIKDWQRILKREWLHRKLGKANHGV